jgi:DNA-binding NarL/FixJ family response regulator
MRVLVVEPDRWRELGITKALEGASDVTAISASELGDRTWTGFDTPAVVLLAERAARTDPKRSLARLRSKFPTAKVIIHGDTAEPAEIADFLSEGADGYFTLSLGEEKLLKAIRVVAKGVVWTPEQSIASLVQKSRTATSRGGSNLSAGETHLLTMLDEGLTNKEMAARMGVAEVTIKARLATLYRRFGLRTRVQLLSYAIRHRLLHRGR